MRLSAAVFCLPALLLGLAAGARAQVVESTGSRALGMGGAFVAVANDSSATWWNPAGAAAGPFLDMALSRATSETMDRSPAHRDGATGFAVTTPPFGFSVYRLQVTQTGAVDSTGSAAGDREDRRIGATVRSLTASQIGVTVLRTLVTGVHVATTLKYLRGTLRGAEDDGAAPLEELLDRGEGLEGGDAAGHFDFDLGVLAVAGPVRLGAVARNLREPEFEAVGTRFTVPRQVRVGIAFDAEEAGGPPLTIALDADARSYDAGLGRRRVIAVGAEQWLLARRVGVRAGFRASTAGDAARTATVGGSVALRSGLFVDGHLSGGGSTSERGWGAAARVSF